MYSANIEPMKADIFFQSVSTWFWLPRSEAMEWKNTEMFVQTFYNMVFFCRHQPEVWKELHRFLKLCFILVLYRPRTWKQNANSWVATAVACKDNLQTLWKISLQCILRDVDIADYHISLQFMFARCWHIYLLIWSMLIATKVLYAIHWFKVGIFYSRDHHCDVAIEIERHCPLELVSFNELWHIFDLESIGTDAFPFGDHWVKWRPKNVGFDLNMKPNFHDASRR